MKERFRTYVWRCLDCDAEWEKKPKDGRCDQCDGHATPQVPRPIAALLEAEGLAEPMCEYRFHPKRKWKFDWAFDVREVEVAVDTAIGTEEVVARRRVLIGVEIDGGTWTGGRHVRGKGFQEDCHKLNEAVCMGWKVLRFSPQEITSGAFLDTLKRAWEAA